MTFLILRLWPGAILTLFYLAFFLTSAKGEASDGLYSPTRQDRHVSSPRQCPEDISFLPLPLNCNSILTSIKANADLGERAPPQYKALAQPHLRHRDPGVLGDLLSNLGGSKGNANKAPATVTVIKALTRNATVLMTAPATTVFVTMPAETITAMMMMTVTAAAPAPAPAPAEPNAPAPAPAEAPGTSMGAGAVANPPGLVSALTLGFLSTESTLATLAARAEVAVVTLSPKPTEMGVGTATVISTLLVANEDAVATGMASTTTMGTEMKSDAVSGRQAGTRCMGFGAVVVAIWVAVLIL